MTVSVVRESHSESARHGYELEWWLQNKCFAVHTDFYRVSRINNECRVCPRQQAPKSLDLPCGFESNHLCHIRGAIDPHADHPEEPGIHSRSGGSPSDLSQLVGVVRDQDHVGCRMRHPIGSVEAKVERLGIGPE
jgi:hypothetical protein